MHVLDVSTRGDGVPVGDPTGEIEIAWQVYQEVRSISHAESPTAGRTIATKVLESLHTCPIGEVKRLGTTLRRWRNEILAYFDTEGVSNGGTEAIRGVIEKVPATRTRLPQLHQLPHPNPARRRRLTPLPTPPAIRTHPR
jgi:hypothetical protein